MQRIDKIIPRELKLDYVFFLSNLSNNCLQIKDELI